MRITEHVQYTHSRVRGLHKCGTTCWPRSLWEFLSFRMRNTKELMHCHYGTNNRAPRWTFTDPCKPEVRPGAWEESASTAWLDAPAMNARDTTKVYIWRLGTGCGPTLYRKCHSQNTPGKRHNNTWVEPLAGNYTTSSTRQREQVWRKCKIQKNWCTVTMAPTIEHHGGHSRTPANQRWDQVPGRSQGLLLG